MVQKQLLITTTLDVLRKFPASQVLASIVLSTQFLTANLQESARTSFPTTQLRHIAQRYLYQNHFGRSWLYRKNYCSGVDSESLFVLWDTRCQL